MTVPQPRTMIITGGTGGIGLQSAIGLAQTGARVLVTGRSQERGASAVRRISDETDNPNVVFVQGDVSSMASVDQLASAIRAETQKIDVLVNNAGYLGSEYRRNEDGLEMHFAINVLAPWRLTRKLLPELQLAGSARVVNVTGGDKPAPVDSNNLQAEKGFKGLMTYTHSKSILESMSMVLAHELEAAGITVNVVFPGRASTQMTRSLSPKSLPGVMKLMYPFFLLFFKEDGDKSAAKAARSTIWAATSPDLKGTTGSYFDTNSKEKRLHPSAYESAVQKQIRAVIDAVEKNSQ